MASEGRVETFVVRHAKSLDDLQWVLTQAADEGWRPREGAAECLFSAGITPDFFIGELNGERVSCICVVRHGESVAFAGFYIVAKPYRGQGYGLKTWKMAAALADIGDQCNGQGVAVGNMKNQHQKMGSQPGWTIKRYTFTASRSLEGLASSQLPPSAVQILPASQADFEKLFAYGADTLGTSRVCKSMLAAWISHAQESSWVAIDNNGEVVGYLIMSKTARFPNDGYRVAPFFADSAPIARSLLKMAAGFAGASNPEHIMFLDIAADLNPDGVNILEKEIGAKPIADFLFMAIEIPTKPHCKMFGLASIDIM